MTETHPESRRLGYARVSTAGQTLDASLSSYGRKGARASIGSDLPPGRPSGITRVLGVDNGWLRVGQARRARSPQIAQAPGARRRGSGWRAMSVA